jgi:stage IV sporulation protein FB
MLAMIAQLFVAILAHELGHALVAARLGYRVRPFLRWWKFGVAVVVPEGGMSARDDRLIALAGPVSSILLTAAAVSSGLLWLAFVSAELAVMNLIPFPGSDGLRALRAKSRAT